MKCQAITSGFKPRRLLLIVLPIFTCSIAMSQPKKILNPSIYNNFIRTNSVVKVQTIEGGMVKNTNTDSVKKIEVPADKKQVISYDRKISAIDKASYQKTAVLSKYAAEDIKIIPELHVEPTTANPAVPGENIEAVTYRIMFTLQQPLHYNDSLGKFSADLGFLLVNESGSNDATIEPVKIEVVSNDASIRPGSFEIKHLSIPSSNVQLFADHVIDSTPVTVITTSHPEGYTTYLKVRPRLDISTNQTSFQGFGIEQVPVTVRFIGSNSNDSALVNLSPQKGSVSPNSIYVHYNRPATVYLRSDGLGNSKLSATSSIGNSNDLSFRYTFPWLFLLASILGGLIGSLAKYFIGGDEKKSWIKPVIGGILIGFIGAVAWYGLGVNLLGISLSPALNALAVLALSALCAYFGISLIKMDGK